MLKKFIWDWIPQRIQDNLILKYIGFFKIPLVNFVGLKMVKRDEKECTLSMPLNRKTKNHVNSVYFACMTVQLEKQHILIAEDENDIMEFLIDLLEEDFEITSVPDVPAGLEKLNNRNLILL